MRHVNATALQDAVTDACQRMGANRENAQEVAVHLVRANLRGVDSHGAFRLVQYHEWWKKGLLNPAARPLTVAETIFSAKVDGRQAFGQVVAGYATRLVIQKATASGIAVVTGMNSNHVGRLGEYAERIMAAGLVGMAAVNDAGSGQVVVPWGGRDPRLSTNPIAMGFPGTRGPGIVFDFATSAAAAGQVRQLLLKGDPAPAGWLLDADGSPTTDPASLFATPRGALLPAGGHKGYALSLAVEVLAGILSGAGFPTSAPGPQEMNGIFLLALDVTPFLPPDQFRARVDQLTAYVKTARPAHETGRVFIPGEPDREEEARRAREGIPFSDEAWILLEAVLRELGVPVDFASD